MGDSNTQICRLCLEITPSGESKPIKDLEKETLKVLPFNIYFYTNVSGDDVACKRCLETVQDWFDFKTRCSNTMDVISFNTSIKKKFLHLVSSGSEGQETSRGCWLCKSLIEVEAFNCSTDHEEGVLVKDIIRNCFPDVYLNAVHEILLCQPCLSSMKNYHKFMRSCQEVVERIEHFRQLSPDGKVILEDVMKFKYNVLDKRSTIKKECLDVGNVDENLMKLCENAGPASIKCEEIDIKDELDEGTTSETHQSDDCDNFEEVGLSKTITEECHRKQRMYKCELCSYQATRLSTINFHTMRTHMDPSKVPKFKCTRCPYKTDVRSYLSTHIRRQHENKGLHPQRCKLCNFSTWDKTYLKQHQRVHMEL